jgi:hypothetical protein
MMPLQELHGVPVMQSITKWSRVVRDTERIGEYVDAAFHQALSGRPGPVFLEIPADTLARSVDETHVPVSFAPQSPARPGPSSEAVDYILEALVAAYRPIIMAGRGVWLGGAADELRAFAGLDADLLVTSAGVSRGDYDLVKEVLAREGQIEFCSVAMKPGKPLAFGSFRGNGRRVPHLGLPGNPVSAMIGFELFGRPLILKMMGKTYIRRPPGRAIATETIANGDCERTLLARCVVYDARGQSYAKLAGGQGSGMLTSMMRANALAVLGPNEHVQPGGELRVLLLDESKCGEWGSYRQSSCEIQTEKCDLPVFQTDRNKAIYPE